MSECFATNAPDQPQWTLNSCFGVFRTVWMYLGPFRCLTKLGAKRAELVQLFVPRSRIGIFSQRKHPIDPMGPQTHVLVCFVPFGCIWYRLVTLQNSV